MNLLDFGRVPESLAQMPGRVHHIPISRLRDRAPRTETQNELRRPSARDYWARAKREINARRRAKRIAFELSRVNERLAAADARRAAEKAYQRAYYVANRERLLVAEKARRKLQTETWHGNAATKGDSPSETHSAT